MLNQKVLHDKTTMTDVLSECLGRRLTFVAYRLPGHTEITVIIQNNHELEELADLRNLPSKSGFLISPFDRRGNEKSYFIRPDIVIREPVDQTDMDHVRSVKAGMVNGVSHDTPPEISKEDYFDQVNQTINKIRSGDFEKVVLSRVKLVEGNFLADLDHIFNLMCNSYPNAFVYVFRIKGHCWIGATPEPLMCSRGNELATVSLAGTRPFSPANMEVNNWNNKERTEQEYVTQYIEDILQKYNVTGYRKKGPYTKRAGNLLHLRTDFNFQATSVGEKLPSLIDSLHPTAAVCGMPMLESREYITSLEHHHREYYAGIVGPIGLDDRLQLYVNLRCMKVLENHLALHIGGGITSESKAEEEWEETEIKWKTLFSVVEQMK